MLYLYEIIIPKHPNNNKNLKPLKIKAFWENTKNVEY